MTDVIKEDFRDHVRGLVGQRLTYPGGKGKPFEVVAATNTDIRFDAGGSDLVIPMSWVTDAWNVLVRRGSLTRSGIRPQTAQYRSGYVFAVLQTHPRVETKKDFPTKLVLVPE